ncbi:uncharacterized protein B0I36DRAFT_323888 [Microdochium trichocladiopsis]|uniref:Fucose-specific lectin n=1 Tax=Microdochium trichocladiopsis TaxID=1682393 RepID=A0A9P8Y592_9PEZI|nr:uncharacterized protein B0I36DRAFT_323888 [Microdochium trichocladiopsis]KAH7031417.1 hypothetical protein B0I36DRAFT_323888 [Microdochium trichocladiopsis]
MSQIPGSPPPQYSDNGSSLPEVVNPGHYPYADAPQVVNSGPQHAPELHYQYGGQYQQPQQQQPYYDQSPEAVYKADEYKGSAAGGTAAPYEVTSNGTAAGAGAGAGGAGADASAKGAPFWRRKRVMLAAAGVLVLVIVGAVVGGVVGSQKAKSSSGSTSSSANGSGPPAVATPSAPLPSSTPSATAVWTPARRPGSAASTSRGNGVFTQGIQLFWQNEGSTDITYSVYNNGADYGPLNKLELSRPPKNVTSLAATSWFVDNNSTKDAIVQLYYLLETDTSGRLDIAMADLVCTHNQTCTEKGTTLITANATAEVDTFSDITAVWRRDQENFKYNNRVYYQAKGSGNIIELSGDSATTTGWGEKDLGVQAQNGSSLTSVFAPGYTMELYYFDATGSMTELITTDHWADPAAIDVEPPAGARGAGVLEACWEPSTNIFRIYHVTDKGAIMEYDRDGVGSQWEGGMSPNGQTVDSTLTASSWDAEVRLFYIQRDEMQRATRGKTSWKIDLLKDI